MGKTDYLNAQGLWSSCFNADAYSHLLSIDSQDLAGNSFSSTVAQAAVMASMVVVPGVLELIRHNNAEETEGDAPEAMQALKRLRLKRKQPAPAAFVSTTPVVPRKRKHAKKKKHYRRKDPAVDGRTVSSKGKKPCATIWQKEQV